MVLYLEFRALPGPIAGNGVAAVVVVKLSIWWHSEGQTMPYRPQFAYPTPPGFTDEEFVYSFDRSNTPSLTPGLLPGQSFLNVPLQLEKDVEYRIRSIEVIDPSGVLGVRFRDAFGTHLTYGGVWVPAGVFTKSGPGLALEPELFCPAGSSLMVDVTNLA